MMLRNILVRARRGAGRAVDIVRSNTPRARAQRQRIAMLRNESEDALAALDGEVRAPVTSDRVLIDGMWDNPNYWLRLAMTRKALGLSRTREVGLLGRYARADVTRSFRRLGIDSLLDFLAMSRTAGRHRAEARRLLGQVAEPAGLMRLQLPESFPGEMFYDVVLKRQRRGVVDMADPLLVEHLAELLACLEGAAAIFAAERYGLVLMTHALSFDFGGIAWVAMRRGIPVLVLYGDFGNTRFIRMDKDRDFFVFPSRPTVAEVDGMPPAQCASLAALGKQQLDLRRGGMSNDSGSQYAYKRRQGAVTRRDIVERFGWDPELPIIGIYAANWFDFPHCTGMWHFRDFVDWAEASVATAGANTAANWLCKAHPIDDRFGGNNGITLADIVAQANKPNVQLADPRWNSDQLLNAIDGVVTHHGLSGIEAASLGKPILITDDAWYADLGLVSRPPSRQAYIDRLAGAWWADWDAEAARARANLLAGWYFCAPDWHGDYVFADDAEQTVIYEWLPRFLARNATAIAREIDEIAVWFGSGHRFFHIFKMSRSAGFQLGNFPVES